jgi:hypothetical protein
MKLHNNKILVSQREMNRLFHKTASLWQVLSRAGARLLFVKENEVFCADANVIPSEKIVGIEIPTSGERFFKKQNEKFVVDNNSVVKEFQVSGLPLIQVETEELKAHRQRW